jgi:hypothetical protein
MGEMNSHSLLVPPFSPSARLQTDRAAGGLIARIPFSQIENGFQDYATLRSRCIWSEGKHMPYKLTVASSHLTNHKLTW